MNLYYVSIKTVNTVKGNDIRISVRARSHEDAMSRALVIRGIDDDELQQVTVTPKEKPIPTGEPVVTA